MVKDSRTIKLELAVWSTAFCMLTLVLPAILTIVQGPELRAAAIATWAGAPLIEYAAISIGIGLGVHPATSFLLTVLPCIGIVCLVMGLLGGLGDSSERARRFLGKVQKKMDKWPRFRRYGVSSMFVFVVVLGIYIGPGVAILLGFPRWRALALMSMSIGLVTSIIGLGTMGLIDLFFV